MLRLHGESARSYPGRSAQHAAPYVLFSSSGEIAGGGYRLTKSRRYRENASCPVSRYKPKGRLQDDRDLHGWTASYEATHGVIEQKSAEAIVVLLSGTKGRT
ncbi:MAG: hypothetical protein ACYTE5_10195 [Planctomycetota bacterium]|jgi:hypothetical protein